MLRLATILALGALLLAPAVATAAGCEVITAPGERAECVARAHAREAARAEVRQRTGDVTAEGLAAAPDAGRSAAWQQAIAEGEGVDARELLDVRLLAAVGGLAWFALLVRRRYDRRRRAR